MKNETNTLDERNNTVPIAGAALSGIGFVLVMLPTLSGAAAPFDDAVREAIYSMRTPGLNTLMEILTFMGNWQTITILCILLLAYSKYRFKYGIPVSAVAILTVAVNKLIKVVVARPRPEDVAALIDEGGFSFASGHSVSTMAVFLLLICLIVRNHEEGSKAKAAIAILAAAIPIVGFSRVYLGVHYPTDVLAGWMEGLFFVCITIIVINSIEKRRSISG